MKRASITETKNQLSALIARVKQGETVLIVERGRSVARLEPVGVSDDEDWDAPLARLEGAGIIRRAKSPFDLRLLKEPPPKLPARVSALQALLEEREDDR
jgi:prevent-host-death family protein